MTNYFKIQFPTSDKDFITDKKFYQNDKFFIPFLVYILREINLAISVKAGCISDLLTEWGIL